MKFGLRARLFVVSIGLVLLAVVVAGIYLPTALEAELVDRFRADLFMRIHLIEHNCAQFDASFDDHDAWDGLADELGRRAEARVSVLLPDGMILGDSAFHRSGVDRVKTRTDQQEITDALARGSGSSLRQSTRGPRFMYVAVPFHRDGKLAGLVRLSASLIDVDNAISRVRSAIVVAGAIALAITLFTSSLAAHWVSRRARALASAAKSMAAGNLDVRTRVVGQDPMAKIGHALDALVESLSKSLTELQTDRDLMGRVIDGMREGILLLDRDHLVALTNPSLRDMLLLAPDVVGKSPLEVIRNAELQRVLDQATSTGQPASSEIELGYLKPRRVLVNASPLPEEGGLIVVFVDMTELRRLEAVRKDFVANVSHELRTPVAAVLSAAETLRRAIETQPEAALDFVEIIERNADRLHRLITDLLDLSRIESREFRLRAEPVPLKSQIDHILSLVRVKADGKQLKLATDVADDLPPAQADRRALEQVLTNLVDNAVKYCAEGTTVTVGAVQDNDAVKVWVDDHGPGIEEKHLPRIFERFYRVDSGRSRDLGGTGLGLAIVKHLVEAMKGTIEVTSTPGQGSRFSFSLPLAATNTRGTNDNKTIGRDE